jgi:glucose/arabinose dehydrogenase
VSNTEITLVPGQDGDEDGNGWTPRLAVDHDGRELYVIVGEEVGGMVEGVPPEVFEALRVRIQVCRSCANDAHEATGLPFYSMARLEEPGFEFKIMVQP